MDPKKESSRCYKTYLHDINKCSMSRMTEHRWNKKVTQIMSEIPDEERARDIGNAVNDDTTDEDSNSLSTDESTELETANYENTDESMEFKTTSGNEDIDGNSRINESTTSCDSSSGNDENELTNDQLVLELDDVEDTGIEDIIMFPASGLSKQSVLTMVYGLSLKHNLTNEVRKDFFELLKICANIATDDDDFKTSNYTISKKFDPKEDELKTSFYCTSCKTLLEEPKTKHEIITKTITCSNTSCCLEQEIGPQSKNIFISVNMIPQIQSVLENVGIIRPEATENEEIADVYDGLIYKTLLDETSFTLSYNFSTDGAPIFKASKLSMWPIQCVINELTPKMRFKHTIFAGIWVGHGEPDIHLMNTFMASFAAQATSLLHEGMTLLKDGKAVTFKMLPLFCICDSVARPLLQNRVQFNGYWGCSWCYQKGVAINRVVKYPFQNNNELRTSASHRQDLEEVVMTGYTEKVRGVKGPSSIIMSIPHVDAVWSFPPDYMHGVILGVVRQLWEIWTTYSPESRHSYYIGKPASLKIVNERLLALRPPHEIHRLPRSINDKAKWKASEWRSWLLYYSFPCLKSILKEVYLNHFVLLITAVFNLLQERISKEDLNESEICLQEFVKNFELHYGESSMTFNVHSLLHLVDSVKRTGPLWATSAFPFESGIYGVKQQVKGPVGVVKQIAKKMFNKNTFLNRVSKDASLSENCKTFCEHLWSPAKCSYIYKKKGVTFLGSGSLLPAHELPDTDVLQDGEIEERVMAFEYKRCVYNGMLLHSTDYVKPKKTNDTIIQTLTGEFIRVRKIFTYKTDNLLYGNILNARNLSSNGMVFKHIFEVVELNENEHVCITIESVRQKCIALETKNEIHYICTFPNTFEIQ